MHSSMLLLSIGGGFSVLGEQQFPEPLDSAKAIPVKILEQPAVDLQAKNQALSAVRGDGGRLTCGART